MDISPYLRKPLRSLQEVVETLKPASAPESAGGGSRSGGAGMRRGRSARFIEVLIS